MYEKYLKEFSKKRILVVGDLMLDKYIFGGADRISQEAPVPIIDVSDEKYVLGGAANTANNIVTLSGKAFLLGVLGQDAAKDIFMKCADENHIDVGGVVFSSNRPTTQKIRVIGQKQQIVRIDYESREPIEHGISKKLVLNAVGINNPDAVIVSDYAKGVLTQQLASELVSYCNKKNIPLIADPKPRHKNYFKGAYLIKTNRKEAEEMTGIHLDNPEDLQRAGNKLIELFQSNVIITLGAKGMAIFEKGKSIIQIPTLAKEVFDVSGAGDTAVAALAFSIASGAALYDAAIISNHCAGVKVTKIGTAPVMLDELRQSLKNEQ